MEVYKYSYLKEELKWCLFCRECIDEPDLYKVIIKDKICYSHINCYKFLIKKYSK